jgi:hypothetical protein
VAEELPDGKYSPVRYVDDFYVVHENRELLKELPPTIARYLKEELGLTLHPKKITLCEVEKGIDFLGVHIKPYRDYLITRTKRNINFMVRRLDDGVGKRLKEKKGMDKRERRSVCASINSYFGYLNKRSTYSLRRKLAKACKNMPRIGCFTPSYGKLELRIDS